MLISFTTFTCIQKFYYTIFYFMQKKLLNYTKFTWCIQRFYHTIFTFMQKNLFIIQYLLLSKTFIYYTYLQNIYHTKS